MSAPPEKSRREEYSEATRQALLSAARDLFAAQGYQETSIEAVARASRVTRGALYHHFKDKRELFDAVVVALQIEAAAAVGQRARLEKDQWARVRAGINAYLDACLAPAFRRLVIEEAPAVLGTARCREIDHAYTLGPFAKALEQLRSDGELDFDDTDLLSRMLGAMIWELAILLADAKDPKKLRRQVQDAVTRVLRAFQTR
ncbi:MAG TPA: helix-turn-helix domain-containing protein [Stellaceae bacterium]